MKLLTISIAAYNVEKFLKKTIDSIIETNRLDLIEILIVNDGSRDNTAKIAKEYQNRYPDSIRLIDKENGGHGSTINRGMIEAKGKYFRALDGDDWVEPGNLRKLIDELQRIDADIILSDFCKCYENGNKEVVSFEKLNKAGLYEISDILKNVDWMNYHTIIFNTELVKKNMVQLDENCFYVDTELMIFYIPIINKVYYYNDFIYCYRLGLSDQSVSPESRMKNISHSRKVAERILTFFNQINEQTTKDKQTYIVQGITNHCIWHYKSLLYFTASKEKKREIRDFDYKIKKYYPQIYTQMGKAGKPSVLINVLRKSKYHLYGLVCWYKHRNI